MNRNKASLADSVSLVAIGALSSGDIVACRQQVAYNLKFLLSLLSFEDLETSSVYAGATFAGRRGEVTAATRWI